MTKRKEREDEGERSKRKRHREEHQAVEHQAVQAAGEEQARKALQEKARKEREANEQWDEICRRATSLRATRLQPGPPPPCPDSWLNTTLPRNHSPSSSSSSSSTAEQPCKRGQRCVSEGSVNNDQDQDFQRQLALVQEEKAEDHKRRSQRACQHRLLVQLLVVLLLLCFVLGVLPQHYFPWTFRLIFFQRVPFRCVFLEYTTHDTTRALRASLRHKTQNDQPCDQRPAVPAAVLAAHTP